MTELDSPILCHHELSEVLQLLLCHGLHNNLHSLTLKIASTFPDMMNSGTSSSYRQLTIFSGFFSKFLSVGPLPYICQFKFLNTLHNGVTGMVRQNSQVFHPMPISDLVKLVAGIRCLLCKAIIMEEKFAVKDVEDFILKYFPTLPVSRENMQAWLSLAEILQFDVKQQNNPTMKIINTINDRSARHLNEKLLCLSRERARSTAEIQASFLGIWKSIEEKLITCMGKIAMCLNRNILEILTQHDNFKLKLVTRGLSPTPSEDELISLVDHLQNVFIESQFWTSDLIRKHLIDTACQSD